MTREEEMLKYIENIYGVLSRRESFIALTAMRWTDKTVLEKACEWLKNELIDTRDNFGYQLVATFDTYTLNEFIEEFKKAMEE